MISIMQPLQSVQMPVMKYKEFLCSLLTTLPNQYLMLHRDWRIKNLRIQVNKTYFFNVLHPFGTETYVVFAMQKEEYSNEAHFSSVLKAIQYSETLVQSQDDFFPDFEAQRPHHFKRFSYSASSLSNYPLGVSNEEQPYTLFLSMFKFIPTMEGKKEYLY
jgi:hypothetical protein